jgi:hypothetical protein
MSDERWSAGFVTHRSSRPTTVTAGEVDRFLRLPNVITLIRLLCLLLFTISCTAATTGRRQLGYSGAVGHRMGRRLPPNGIQTERADLRVEQARMMLG